MSQHYNSKLNIFLQQYDLNLKIAIHFIARFETSNLSDLVSLLVLRITAYLVSSLIHLFNFLSLDAGNATLLPAKSESC